MASAGANNLPEAPSSRGGDANIVALLSLKLMLLAFFLLLVSLSSLQEQKVMLVIESVNDVFDGKIKSKRSLPVFESALQELDGSKDVRQQIARLFKQYIPASRIEELDQGHKLRISLPLPLFFAEDGASFQIGPGLLLDRLVGLLQHSSALAEARVAVQQSWQRDGPAAEAELDLAARRMATLARAFIRRGQPAEQVAAGFGDAPAGELWITIENIDGQRPAG